MAWKPPSKEGIAFLGSVLLQTFSIVQNPANNWDVKILVVILYFSLIPIVMYEKNKRKVKK